MTTIQRVYGKGRYDGVIIGATFALFVVFLISLMVRKLNYQTYSV